MQAWAKRDLLSDESDVHLVRMAKGVTRLLKLTRRKPDLLPIDMFEEAVRDVIARLDVRDQMKDVSARRKMRGGRSRGRSP